ncbi:MAG: ParB/RepB/Spo0J family partition protein [Clostridia bacterium]|nr:ParB/RepB/Spo0J family partition protein [Clostridia bacterium]
MARKKNSGLGRGLDAIFLDNAQLEEAEKKEGAVSNVRISLVDPKSDQPRKYFDKEALEELSESIREHGLLQPILVREYGEGRYQIIAGERRFRASKLAGLEEIPAIILDRDDKAAAQIALIENIQREDLNPLEEALAYRSLQDEYDMTQEELSFKVGKSRSAVANAMRLLDLPEEVLSMVAARDLSAGHARTLLGLKRREDMIILAERAAAEELSVRVLEELVKKFNKTIKERLAPKDEEESVEEVVDYIREMELKIQRELGRKAEIKAKGRKKTLTLYYEDNEDLDELLRALCGDKFFDEV